MNDVSLVAVLALNYVDYLVFKVDFRFCYEWDVIILFMGDEFCFMLYFFSAKSVLLRVHFSHGKQVFTMGFSSSGFCVSCKWV